jgi:hypothetical protein
MFIFKVYAKLGKLTRWVALSPMRSEMVYMIQIFIALNKVQ